MTSESGFLMMIVLLIIQGLLAAALLGAITHQAIGVWLPVRPGPEFFKSKDGRAMKWYGWLASAALGAWVIAAVTSWPPGAVSARIGPLWSWLTPSLVMINFAYLLRSFFLR